MGMGRLLDIPFSVLFISFGLSGISVLNGRLAGDTDRDSGSLFALLYFLVDPARSMEPGL